MTVKWMKAVRNFCVLKVTIDNDPDDFHAPVKYFNIKFKVPEKIRKEDILRLKLWKRLERLDYFLLHHKKYEEMNEWMDKMEE